MTSLREQLEHKNNLLNLIKLICIEYKLDPRLQSNIINIKSFLVPIKSEHVIKQAKTLDEANKYIVKLYGDTIKANRITIPDEIDKTKKYLLKVIKTPGDDAKNMNAAYKGTFANRIETFKETFDGIGTILDMSMPERIETIKYLNYQSLHRDEYIMIDSRYQNKVNPDPTKMVFSLISNTKTKSDHGGIIIGNTIKDIIELEIYPFSIPYKPVYVTFYNKITLSINEWVASSFEAYEGGQFHFCFDIDYIDNNLIYLKPVNTIYSFSKPVNHIDDFTLSLGAVYPKISFDADRMYPKTIDYTNEYGLIIFDEPHNLVTGDLIYISGFGTPDPARDVDIITEVNRAEGHIIVKKDNYSIIINVDLTTVRHEEPIGSGRYPIEEFNQDILIYFASKRIQIQMRIRYLTSYT